MRLIVSRKGLGLLIFGIAIQMTSLVLLSVHGTASTFCCLDTPSSSVSAVVSPTWVVSLSVFIVVAIGAVTFRVFAALGLVTTIGATIAIAYFTFLHYPAAYLSPPWFPAAPIDWLGAALALTTLFRAIHPKAVTRPKISLQDGYG
jgi:hypothetical protein